MRRLWLILLASLLLAACASNAPAPVADSRGAGKSAAATAASGKSYVVKKGDTLHSIALDHGIDYRDLIVWNGIDNPNRIRVGQTLRVGPAGETNVAPSGAEVRPIASNAPVVSRSLEERPLGPMGSTTPTSQPAPAAVPPAPTFLPDSDKLKRAPKGGKLPYSPENLAKLKAAESAPVPAAVPVQAELAAPSRPPLAAEKPVPVMPAPAAPAASAGQLEWAWPSAGKVIANFTEGGSATETNKGLDFAGKLGDPVLAAAAGKVIHVGSEIRGLGNFVVIKHNQDFLSVYGNNSRILVKQDQTVTRGQKIAELGNSDADQPKLHFEVRQQGKPVDPLRFLPPR